MAAEIFWLRRNNFGWFKPAVPAGFLQDLACRPANRFCLRITSHIAPPPTKPKPAIVGYQTPQPYRSISQPVAGSAMAAPKYWNESITPEAKPDIRRPPMSIGAAAPTSECVELTVSEIITRKKQPRKTPAGVGPTKPE